MEESTQIQQKDCESVSVKPLHVLRFSHRSTHSLHRASPRDRLERSCSESQGCSESPWQSSSVCQSVHKAPKELGVDGVPGILSYLLYCPIASLGCDTNL